MLDANLMMPEKPPVEGQRGDGRSRREKENDGETS